MIFNALIYFKISFNFRQVNRNFILKNICVHLFQKYQKVNEISVFIVSTTVSELNNRKVSGKKSKTLIAKIKKNE